MNRESHLIVRSLVLVGFILIGVSLALFLDPECRLLTLSAGAQSDEAIDWDARALARFESPPLGLPAVPVPDDNPPTIEKIVLGRKLFFDRRLSFNNTMSCGMCHVPEQGFTNNQLATPVGVEGRSLRRNAPTTLNSAYFELMFHDGREISLELQTISPLIARNEMANPSIGWVIKKIRSLEDYDGLFEAAFDGGPSVERIGFAIASWERTVLAGDSPFDRWYYAEESNALTESQQKGFELFKGKGLCIACHSVGPRSAIFTDNLFHNTGIGVVSTRQISAPSESVAVEISPGQFIPVPRSLITAIGEPREPDLGRFEITLDPRDRWKFKTPSLRNVAMTAPYMHDGSIKTLDEVLHFYNRGGVPHETVDPLIQPLHLSGEEMMDLVEFLRSLTASNLPELQADARSAPIGN